MRIHTDHNGVAVNAISTVYDSASPNGRNVEGHLYQVLHGATSSDILFQRGPVQEASVNGLTNEALLAILIHRTKFLDAKFPCDENKRAIQHMEEALTNLEVRTARRITRGVEGQSVA